MFWQWKDMMLNSPPLETPWLQMLLIQATDRGSPPSEFKHCWFAKIPWWPMPSWNIRDFFAIIYQNQKSSWFSPKFACEQPKRHFQDFSIFSLDGKSMWKTFCNEQIVVHLIFHCFSGREQKLLKKVPFFVCTVPNFFPPSWSFMNM